MFDYKSRPAIDTRLRLLDYAVEDDTYSSVLHTLGKGVQAATARIADAAKTASPETAEFMADNESEIIENLLGAAYVVCQAQITAITQAARLTRKQALRDKITFTVFSDASHELRSLAEPFDSNWSKIEILWALANYFKHREEWPPSTWSSPTGPAKYTVPVIKAAGLEPSSTGNLRRGAEILGNPDYSAMTVFIDIIRPWSEDVRNRARQACKKL